MPPKRKAEVDAPSGSVPPSEPAPGPEPQHASRDQHAPLHDAVRQPRFSAPEARSILAMVRDNHRSRLYLPPLLWTAEQVKLLGCRFLAKEAPSRDGSDGPTTPEAQPDDGGELPKFPAMAQDRASRAARLLSEPCIVEARTFAVMKILALLDFHIAL